MNACMCSTTRCRNETFDLMVYDKETQSVLFEVFDYDFSTKVISTDDFLGRATLNLDRIQMLKPMEFQMRLHDTKSGSLDVVCEYCPLKKNGRVKYSEDDMEGRDIIFHYSADAFTTDILEEEPTSLFLSSDDESFFSDENDSDDTRPTSADTPKSKKHSMLNKFNPFYTDESRSPQPRSATKEARRTSLTRKSIETTEAKFRRSVNGNGQNDKRSMVAGGVLSVTHMSCRNLEKSTRNLTRKLRPYIEVSVENQVKRTESKRKIKNPCFEETFNFLVVDANVGVIKFKILNEFSMLKDVCIGRFSVDVSEVKMEGRIEKQFILDGSSDSQIFACTLEWVEVLS